jgi:aminoglycoside phosphotransferase (APT) family kinase protein
MALTNETINHCREATCFAITPERKYFHAGNSFIKRSLRSSEWQTTWAGTVHVPRMNNEKLLNEGAALDYIRRNTNIPVPTLHACFEDDKAVVLVTEYIEGVGMNELDEKQKKIVTAELEHHLTTLRTLRSSRLGGPTGIVIPPYRVTDASEKDDWTLKPSTTEEYVFCHNDLSQHNVIVDPETLKIAAIVDWEYAGFWPEWFEMRLFERVGPSVALDGEDDDTARLMEFLGGHSVKPGDGTE